MGLPVVSLPREEVELPGGGTATVRGLSRQEVTELKPLLESVDEDNPSGEEIRDLETRLLAYGCDVTLEEAQAFYGEVSGADITPMVTAILRLSGLKEDEEGRPTLMPSAAA